MQKKIAAVLAVAVLGLGMTGCGVNDKRDMEDVSSYDPEYAEVYNNTDGRPNIGLVCVRGAGFATTTRDFTSLMRVEKWDAFCAQFPQHSVDKGQLRKNGGS
jgi:hypothetical protein